MASPTLPVYVCHKRVRAGKIVGINSMNRELSLDVGPCQVAVQVSVEYMAKHKPQLGGYFVRYEDGYESFSPAAAFEGGYAPAPPNVGQAFHGGVDFGTAIRLLRGGRRMMRAGWNGKGMWLALQVPDAGSKMSLPYIYMRTVQGDLVPWLASQTDMLAEDWCDAP